MTVYIYGLYDPRNGNLRYIGKTIDLKVRFLLHMSEKRNTHKNQWLKQLKSLGLSPELKVLETIENSNDLDWQDRERWWIQAAFETGDPITNLDSGGRLGMKKSLETRAKISASNMGKKMPVEAVEKMKATKRANLTPEVRERIRLGQLGKKQSAETIAKRSAALKGRVVTEETRRKIGEANRSNYANPEIRATMRERNLKQENISPIFRARN